MLRNWSVKETSPAFIQELLGWLQLMDCWVIGKGRSGVTMTQGREWSRYTQRFQESAQRRKATAEPVTEEGREAIRERTHSISKVP